MPQKTKEGQLAYMNQRNAVLRRKRRCMSCGKKCLGKSRCQSCSQRRKEIEKAKRDQLSEMNRLINEALKMPPRTENQTIIRIGASGCGGGHRVLRGAGHG